MGSVSAAAVLPYGDYPCEYFRSRDATHNQLSISEKIKSLYDADRDDEASQDCSSGPRRVQAHRRVGEPDQSVQPAGYSQQLPRASAVAPVAAARDPHRATRFRFGEMGTTCVAMAHADEVEMTLLAFVLSCRVFGYGVERSVPSRLESIAVEKGARRLVGCYVRTP